MKLFGDRAIDYFRSAGPEDRRYLLFNPITKMKVTTEGEKVIDDLWDVIAAKGFEKDTFFEMAARDIRGLPKLEGTVHVNMALVLKFMANYLFNPAEYPPVPQRRDAADDEFLFRQGPAKGLGKIQFNDWRASYAPFADVPNVARFMEQAEGLGTLLGTAPPSEEQQRELGFLLTLGELFTLVVYGQLILEQAALTDLDADTIDAIFDVLVRDFSATPSRCTGHPSSTEAQQAGRSPTSASPSATRTGSSGSGTRWSGTRVPTRCSPSAGGYLQPPRTNGPRHRGRRVGSGARPRCWRPAAGPISRSATSMTQGSARSRRAPEPWAAACLPGTSTSPTAIRCAISPRRCTARLGPVDLLVNNAGVGLAARFLDTELEDWDWVVGDQPHGRRPRLPLLRAEDGRARNGRARREPLIDGRATTRVRRSSPTRPRSSRCWG